MTDIITTAHIVAAREASETFETDTRDNGERFVKSNREDGSWIDAAIYVAHGDMLPDDYRYRFISEAFDRIADAISGTDRTELGDEFADDVDVYTSSLCQWLGSHLDRLGYCDEAVEEGLISEDSDMARRLAIGQYMERREVFEYVASAVEERASELLETWEDEARELGAEHARNAASWVTDGNDTDDSRRRKLQRIEDGDASELIRMPDLSGEFADDPTPLSIARDITGEDDPDSDTQDALAQAYEDGVSETFEDACVSELRKYI